MDGYYGMYLGLADSTDTSTGWVTLTSRQPRRKSRRPNVRLHWQLRREKYSLPAAMGLRIPERDDLTDSEGSGRLHTHHAPLAACRPLAAAAQAHVLAHMPPD